MLTHPTLEQLRQLGLAGMARAFDELQTQPAAGELAPAEWLGLLLDREVTERQDRRLKARLRFAKLRHQASIEDVDWRASCGLDRALFQKLAMGEWIAAKENLIIEGPTGVGKSWLACALGQMGEPTVADAILNRIVHNTHRIQLRGDSRRRKRGTKAVEA